MNKQDYKIIAGAIWRSGFIKDKNKIKQQAKSDMQRLIVSNFIGEFKNNDDFNEEKFLQACGLLTISEK
jgi:hypothetical protein